MISKELLSEILHINVETDEDIYCDVKNNIEYWKWIDNVQYERRINIYELAHKCKEWAWDLGYEVSSKKDLEDRNWYTSFRANENLWVCRKSDTEPEAIFEACQWILDNKDK